MAASDKSAFDRRHFIKTTAAAAAASVGQIPGIASANSGLDQTSARIRGASTSELPSWEITDKEVETIWTEIWPKIVALSWKCDTYREMFENNYQFRVDEAKRIAQIIGVNYTSNIPINITRPSNLGIGVEEILDVISGFYCQRLAWRPKPKPRGITCESGLYGDTYFLINRQGFVMPWPQPPSETGIYIGYFEGGGVLPRTDPNARTPEEQARIDAISKYKTPPGESNPQGFPLLGLSGVALTTLFEKWPKIVALTWHEPAQIALVKSDPRAFIMPEVWAEWPAIATEYVDVDETDVVLKHPSGVTTQDGETTIALTVPLPPKPPDPPGDPPVEATVLIFDELISGYASNPMYSNCY